MRKFFQYLKVVLICGPAIIYYHFRYMVKFARNPSKYPLEERYAVARKEIQMVLKHFHVDSKIENLEMFTKSNEKALLISNHLSFVDPLMIIAKSEKPVTFVAKKEVFDYPFAGKVAKALEVFGLDRENLMSQLSEIKKIICYLKDPNKPSVIIYIEGTRNKHPENECLEFHPGTLKISQMAGVKLMIGATYGSFRVLSKTSYLKSYPCFFKLMNTIEAEEAKKENTVVFAQKLKEKIDRQVDDFRRQDIKYINDMKISKKIKKSETRFDIRVKA